MEATGVNPKEKLAQTSIPIGILSLALVRLLEIVGEAANRVTTASTICNIPTFPGLKLSVCGNRLIHGYDAIDLDILWQILSEDLPALITQLKRIIKSQE